MLLGLVVYVFGVVFANAALDYLCPGVAIGSLLGFEA